MIAAERHRHRTWARAALATLLALAMGAAAAPSASALGNCQNQPEVRVLYSGTGKLESVGVDRKGRVFFTDATNGQLLRLRKNGTARVLASGIDAPGGIIFKRKSVLVGFGDSIEQAADGRLNPEAGLLKVDPRTGASGPFVDGLQMANGVARGPGGAIYASNDIGTGIDRIARRQVELGWANVISPNGLVADSSGRFLFANQTFTAAGIQRIPLDDPGAATTYYSAPLADVGAGFDGLARGAGDTLYVAANGAGQVWRIDGPGSACVLATRVAFPSGPSDLAFANGRGFAPGSLLVTTFGGELLELVGAG